MSSFGRWELGKTYLVETQKDIDEFLVFQRRYLLPIAGSPIKVGMYLCMPKIIINVRDRNPNP